MIEEAIQKAIEGGYDAPAWVFIGWERGGTYSTVCIFLDPLFWQALEEWWDNRDGENYKYGHFDWKKQWHYFIDHLAEGEDADSFFNELLK